MTVLGNLSRTTSHWRDITFMNVIFLKACSSQSHGLHHTVNILAYTLTFVSLAWHLKQKDQPPGTTRNHQEPPGQGRKINSRPTPQTKTGKSGESRPFKKQWCMKRCYSRRLNSTVRCKNMSGDEGRLRDRKNNVRFTQSKSDLERTWKMCSVIQYIRLLSLLVCR